MLKHIAATPCYPLEWPTVWGTDAKLALALHFSNVIVSAIPSGSICSLLAGFSKATISTKPYFPNVSFDCSIRSASCSATMPARSNSYINIAFTMGGAMVASTPTIECESFSFLWSPIANLRNFLAIIPCLLLHLHLDQQWSAKTLQRWLSPDFLHVQARSFWLLLLGTPPSMLLLMRSLMLISLEQPPIMKPKKPHLSLKKDPNHDIE